MNIKELRNKTNLSQSAFAKKYNISVRTLQQWEQGISKPLDSLVVLISKDIESNSFLRFKYNHSNENKWNICIEEPFMNCNKVYPLQQKKVKELIDDLSCDKNVKRIIVFGSSITNRCNVVSDVDIYFESDDINSKLNKLHDFEYDLWSNFNVDERLKKEIMSKGEIVYERNKELI